MNETATSPNKITLNPTEVLDHIIVSAIKARASDIHFEPERTGFNVRFRIDGLLHPVENLEKYAQDQIISRIKVLSQIDITEHRFPQDGHFEFPHEDKLYNIRVSTMPSTYGETVVFRIHNREDILINLENLGLLPEQMELLRHLISSPSGMILITGPTSSGKTNLLYSILNDLNKPEKKILTLEDPIEYQMNNIRQTEISEAAGLTFAKAMRSVVRQDPDVIMVGEIRDAETAQLATQASLTGILVMSTFHTFDVPALVNRLMEMGVSSTVIAQSIQGVVLTRLVRKTCEACKQPVSLTAEQEKLFPEFDGKILYKGRGCPICQNLGYFGRTGVFEIIHFDEDVKSAIIDHKPTAGFEEIIRQKEQTRLRDSAIKKALEGITSIDEVIRVIGYFDSAKS